MKLLKLSEEHYIIADKVDVKIGDWITDKYNVWQWKDYSSLLGRLKVTHSSKPLRIIYGDNNKETAYYAYLPISEVKELLGLVDVKKKAEEFYEFWYDKYGTSKIDTIERNAVSHGFWGAYNQFLEDNKEKKYTEEDMLRAYREGENVRYSRVGEAVLEKQFIQSIQPKTEWDVDVIDGKLKFI